MPLQTVYDAFRATAERTPNAAFLYTESVTAASYDIAKGETKWREAADEIERLRVAYAAAGYGHGHRVGLMLENRPAFVFHWLALNALGVSVVPIDVELPAAELAYLIGHSGMVLAVTLPGRAADLASAALQAGAWTATAPARDSASAPAGALATFEAAAAGSLPPALVPPPRHGDAIDQDSECALLYTSGRTAQLQGCMLDNAYFLHAGEWYAGLDEACEVRPDRERVMTPLPLHHVNAMAFSLMVVLVAGGCLVQLDRFHPHTWWQSVRESAATIIQYLGVMPAMLLAADPREADTDHSVRWGFGAGVDEQDHAPFEARFGFPLVEGWIMTETGAGAVVMATREPRHVGTRCFGRPEPAVEVMLVDAEGAEVEVGTPGELLVRAAGADPRRHFFSGYLHDQAATEKAWRGGWFHTGNLVRADVEGNLYFVDR